MKIKNAKDLAQYLGCNPTEESISRAIYKGTSCGAWAELEDALPTGRMKQHNWKVDIHRSIIGPVVVKARYAKGRKWYKPEEFPKELAEVLGGLRFRSGRWLLAGQEEIDFVNKNSKRGRYFDVGYTAYSGGYRSGVSFGSIVEGVEATTTVHSVMFPCESEEIETAVQAVEDEAREIWDRTHGCTHCGVDWDGDGLRSVDPDCQHCYGHGVVI
jgi:hypothetical protein